MQHYLVLDPEKRLVIHYARREAEIATTIRTAGSFELDPPGMEAAVSDLFPSG